MPKLKVAPAIKMFVPERWSQATRFQKLHHGTHRLDDDAERALTGIMAHYEKCMLLTELAEKLEPNLKIDNQELYDRGHTRAIHSKEVAAVIEAAILELYSSVDCMIQVLQAIYKDNSRGKNRRTSAIFKDVWKISGVLPERFKLVIADAHWYEGFRRIRNELVHAETGAVHLNEQNGSVVYIHPGITVDGKSLVLEDVFGWLMGLNKKINRFLDEVFHHLNETLENKLIKVLCGMTEGRFLERWVSPVDELTFDSGMCASWQWFEKPENPTCPFKEYCGAYRNKAAVEESNN